MCKCFHQVYVKQKLLFGPQAVGGTLSAAVNIVAIAIGGDPRRSAFGYFLTATLCSIFALFAYFALFYLVMMGLPFCVCVCVSESVDVLTGLCDLFSFWSSYD